MTVQEISQKIEADLRIPARIPGPAGQQENVCYAVCGLFCMEEILNA